jgi:ABC-type amino acid transport substrate-binding protein
MEDSMENPGSRFLSRIFMLPMVLGVLLLLSNSVFADDLPDIKKRGVLRHLGIPYARFVSEDSSSGLDVELMRLFAQHLGVKYEYVKTDWSHAISDLTGQTYHLVNGSPVVDGTTAMRGDIIANGLTILPWRQHLIDFSIPTFPTGIWLVARADSPIKPITTSGDITKDIASVRALLNKRSILAMENTCLDPQLYALKDTGAEVRLHDPNQGLNDMALAVIRGEAEATILDIPDALIALESLAGEIKIIGPIVPRQIMGSGFRKDSPLLRQAFDRFFQNSVNNGTYRTLVEKYYPSVFLYLGDFFEELDHQPLDNPK